MNANSDFNGVNESNADSYNDSTTISQIVAFLENYSFHTMIVIVDNQVLPVYVNGNDEGIHNLSFRAESRNGLKVEIITQFIDKVDDNLRESIPLIKFRGIRKYVKVINTYSPTYLINVKQLKMIYQHFEKIIPLATIPIENSVVTIPITLDGIQIDITIKKIGQNQYVVTEIDI